MKIEVREDNVIIEGYVNAVERLSKPLNSRAGKFIERIRKGAFQRALDRAEDVKILLNHQWEREIGNTKNGSLELYEDAIGLHARAVITDSDVIQQARNNNLIGWSFGFRDREVEYDAEQGMMCRNVKDMDLYEVSVISKDRVPAYDGTLVTVRTSDDSEEINISEILSTDATTEDVGEQANQPIEREVEETREQSAEVEEVKEEEKVEKIDYTKYHQMIDDMKKGD